MWEVGLDLVDGALIIFDADADLTFEEDDDKGRESLSVLDMTTALNTTMANAAKTSSNLSPLHSSNMVFRRVMDFGRIAVRFMSVRIL